MTTATTTKATTKATTTKATTKATTTKANNPAPAPVQANNPAPAPVQANNPAPAALFKGLQGVAVQAGALPAGTGAYGRYAKAANITHATHVQVLVSNPKRVGSNSYTRFMAYGAKGTVSTVQDVLKAGVTRADLQWDLAHGHIAALVVAPLAQAAPATK